MLLPLVLMHLCTEQIKQQVMNLKHISIFNLIEVFKGRQREVLNTISPETHCEQNYISDFYCGVETPHIMSNAMASNL